jgi:hypothetical protein
VCAGALARVGRALWRRTVTRFWAAITSACSCVVTYDHARRAGKFG